MASRAIDIINTADMVHTITMSPAGIQIVSGANIINMTPDGVTITGTPNINLVASGANVYTSALSRIFGPCDFSPACVL